MYIRWCKIGGGKINYEEWPNGWDFPCHFVDVATPHLILDPKGAPPKPFYKDPISTILQRSDIHF